jgi:hypothetical protein
MQWLKIKLYNDLKKQLNCNYFGVNKILCFINKISGWLLYSILKLNWNNHSIKFIKIKSNLSKIIIYIRWISNFLKINY